MAPATFTGMQVPVSADLAALNRSRVWRRALAGRVVGEVDSLEPFMAYDGGILNVSCDSSCSPLHNVRSNRLRRRVREGQGILLRQENGVLVSDGFPTRNS